MCNLIVWGISSSQVYYVELVNEVGNFFLFTISDVVAANRRENSSRTKNHLGQILLRTQEGD